MKAEILNKGGDEYLYLTPESKHDIQITKKCVADGYKQGFKLAIPLDTVLKRE